MCSLNRNSLLLQNASRNSVIWNSKWKLLSVKFISLLFTLLIASSFKFILEHKQTQSTPKLWLVFHVGVNISDNHVGSTYPTCTVKFPKSHKGLRFSKQNTLDQSLKLLCLSIILQQHCNSDLDNRFHKLKIRTVNISDNMFWGIIFLVQK